MWSYAPALLTVAALTLAGYRWRRAGAAAGIVAAATWIAYGLATRQGGLALAGLAAAVSTVPLSRRRGRGTTKRPTRDG